MPIALAPPKNVFQIKRDSSLTRPHPTPNPNYTTQRFEHLALCSSFFPKKMQTNRLIHTHRVMKKYNQIRIITSTAIFTVLSFNFALAQLTEVERDPIIQAEAPKFTEHVIPFMGTLSIPVEFEKHSLRQKQSFGFDNKKNLLTRECILIFPLESDGSVKGGRSPSLAYWTPIAPPTRSREWAEHALQTRMERGSLYQATHDEEDLPLIDNKIFKIDTKYGEIFVPVLVYGDSKKVVYCEALFPNIERSCHLGIMVTNFTQHRFTWLRNPNRPLELMKEILTEYEIGDPNSIQYVSSY